MPTPLERRLDRIEAAESPPIGLADLLRAMDGDADAIRRVAEDGGRSPLMRALAECTARGEGRERAALEGAPQERGNLDA